MAATYGLRLSRDQQQGNAKYRRESKIAKNKFGMRGGGGGGGSCEHTSYLEILKILNKYVTK